MYKTVEKGGLAVPEISSKLESMLLTPILKAYLNENQEILWHCFANPWVSQQVSNAWKI